MNRIIFSLLFVILIACKSAMAQPPAYSSPSGVDFENMFIIGWDVNIPMGDEKLVDEVSFAGGKIEYRKMCTNNFSLGFDLSWNSYFEYKPYQTYHLSNSTDVTTDLYTYNYTLPMAVTGDYYFNCHSGLFVPYVGLGLGATYAAPSVFLNIYELSDYNWGFLVRPELGTVIKFEKDSDMGILLATRYSYSTNKEPEFKIDGLQSLGFQLGIVWMY